MDNILQYIHSHLNDAPSVENMAKMCGLSSRQFYNIFFKINKTNPKNYITRLRMEKSSYLLLNTNRTVDEIACMTGYSDQFYFSRAFKNYFGFSPQNFRKEQGQPGEGNNNSSINLEEGTQ
jgi:iron complex transport system substrate-binding protein